VGSPVGAMEGCSLEQSFFCTHQRVGGRGGCVEAFGVILGGAAIGADLGGSSNYSNANFEG